MKHTILLIDDDDTLRNMLKVYLEKHDFSVLEAENGKIGIELYKEHEPDLVITDIIMPDMEGLETIKELKRHDSGIKIIVISGGGRLNPDTYLNMAKQFGVQRTFIKPFHMKDMLAAVKKLTEDSSVNG